MSQPTGCAGAVLTQCHVYVVSNATVYVKFHCPSHTCTGLSFCCKVWDGYAQGYPGPGHTGAGNGELAGLNRPSMSKLIGGEPHIAQSRMADTLHQVLA